MSEQPGGPEAETDSRSGSFAASRRIAFNAVVRGIGEVVAKAANVALFVAIARKLGTGDFGDFVFGLSLSSVLLGIAGLGTDDLIAREIARDKTRAGHLFSHVIGLKGSLLVVFLGVLGAIVMLGDYDTTTRIAVMLIGGGTAFETLSSTVYAVFQGFEKMQYIAVTLIIQRISTTALAVVALFMGAGLVVVSAMVMIGGAIGFSASVLLMRSKVVAPKGVVDRGNWYALAKAGLPLGIVTLLFTMLLKLDASMLSFLSDDGNDSVGIYGSAYRLIEATMFLTWAFGGAVLPWLSRHAGEEGGVDLARGFELGLKALAGILLPIALIYSLFANQLIGFFYGNEFDDAIPVLQLLAAMTVLYGINTYCAIVLISRDRPGLFARAAALTLVQNASFNFVLIPKYGAQGAAFNAILSGLILAFASLRAAGSVTGSRSRVSIFLTPAIAAAAMAGVILLTGTTVLSAIFGLLVYPAAFLGAEKLLFADDFELYAGMLKGFRNRREHDLPPMPPRELGEIGP